MEGKVEKDQELLRKTFNKFIHSTDDYSDLDIKEQIPNYDKMSWHVTKSVHQAFIEESKYVKNFRIIFSWLFGISFLIIVSLIVYISFQTIIIEKNYSLPNVLTSLSSLVATVVSLLVVQFKYIYNRKENKLLDIIRDILKISSEHEREKNKKN